MKILFWAAALAAMLFGALFVAGCGGGGDKPSVYGTARIHVDAERPRASILDLDSYGQFYSVTTGVMERSSSGWQSKPWTINLPGSNSYHVFGICAFNDRDNNGGYTSYIELLGFPKTASGKYIFLAHMSDDSWRYIDEDGYTVASNAEDYSLYIYCIFTRDISAEKTAYIAEKIRELQLKQ